jgi:hypothetical protein
VAGVILQSLNYILNPEKRKLIFKRGWAILGDTAYFEHALLEIIWDSIGHLSHILHF